MSSDPAAKQQSALRCWIVDNNNHTGPVDPYWHFQHKDGEVYDRRVLRLWVVRLLGIRAENEESVHVEILRRGGEDEGMLKGLWGLVITMDPEVELFYEYTENVKTFDREILRDPQKWVARRPWDEISAADQWKPYAINISALRPGQYRARVLGYTSGKEYARHEFYITRATIYRESRQIAESGTNGERATVSNPTAPVQIMSGIGAFFRVNLPKATDFLSGLIPGEVLKMYKVNGLIVKVGVEASKRGQKGLIQWARERENAVVEDIRDIEFDNVDVREMDKEARRQSEISWKEEGVYGYARVHLWGLKVYVPIYQDNVLKEYHMKRRLSIAAMTIGEIGSPGIFTPLVTRWRIIPRSMADSIKKDAQISSGIDGKGSDALANSVRKLYMDWVRLFSDSRISHDLDHLTLRSRGLGRGSGSGIWPLA